MYVCGYRVSGSGKSTLVNEIMGKAMMARIYRSKEKPGKHKDILGLENIDKVIEVSQDPIGRTPRSNPVTYTGVFDDIRDLFAQTNEAKMRGYDKGRFSFNVKGGRCEACQGDGLKRISMHFYQMFMFLVNNVAVNAIMKKHCKLLIKIRIFMMF